MGRAAVALTAAALLSAAAPPARAVPLGGAAMVSEGFASAGAAGPQRADATFALAIWVQVHRALALRLTLGESLERLAPSVRVAALLRPLPRRGLDGYLVAGVGAVAADVIATPELSAGAGLWWRVAPRLARFVESAAVVLLGRAVSVEDRVTVGLALVTPSWW